MKRLNLGHTKMNQNNYSGLVLIAAAYINGLGSKSFSDEEMINKAVYVAKRVTEKLKKVEDDNDNS